MRRELALKGIDRETVEAVLAERDDAANGTHAIDAGAAGVGADEQAAERLLAKNRTALARIADPRSRRGWAYALLARNGFDPEVCREVSGRWASPEAEFDD